MELERIHRSLLIDISDHMDVASSEYENFIEHMKVYVPKGLLAGQKTLLGKFAAMERGGNLKPGYYEKLKAVCTASGNIDILEMIEEAERRIKQIEQLQQDEAVLARIASEKDLVHIAKSVGSNWEMLAPHLLKKNAMVKVEQIKEDYHRSEERRYQLLLTWSIQAAPDTTLGHLFHQMLQVGTSVTVDWRTIAEYLHIEERYIKACKHGSKPPAKEKPTDQPPHKVVFTVVIAFSNLHFTEQMLDAGPDIQKLIITQQLQIAIQNLFISLPGVIRIRIVGLQPGSLIVTLEIETDGQQTEEQIKKILLDMVNRGGFSNYRVRPDVFEFRRIEVQHSAQRLPVRATNEERMEVDSGPVTEEVGMEVVEEHGEDEVVEPSLEDKRRSKTYRPPKDACVFDGRLIKLEEKDIRILENTCTNEIGSGGFGKVYSNCLDDSTSNGFGMGVVVKKIKVPNIENDDHIRSIRREMITSRIMHPFILPLLAVVDRLKRNSEFWFVSPLCKNGDLHAAIKGSVTMTEMTRVKILLHIALAIEYIHTKVPNVREVILHKDISSKNVVLDDGFNARLIDFGLAREKDDETTNVQGKVYYSHPDFGKHDATESWDYYSFGVVIREMLTGLEPQGNGSRFLKFMTAAEIEKILLNLKERKESVWSASGRDKTLNSMAEKCRQQNDWTVGNFNKTVVEEIKVIWKDFGQSKLLDVPKDHSKCHTCMINPKAKESSLTQEHKANCRQKIEVCIACEKNSFLNPVTCYCGTELQPVIGSKSGALLVAGNDLKDTSLAEALTKDIMELKKLLTSRAPRIMGIRDDKVRVVGPSTPGQLNPGEQPEHLWPKVEDCINVFSKDKDIDTLVIYFSCHGARTMDSGDAKKDNSFELGSESITMAKFEEKLECLENIDKLVIVLDRCYPPMIKFQETNRKFVQINACKEDQQADIKDEGSIFTKYLIQGLKASSERMRCPSDCQCCIDYWTKSTDFITTLSLFDYVKKHMKEVTPTMVSHLLEDSSNIAFYTDEQVLIEFEDCIGGTKKEVPLEYLQDMEQLETELLQAFGRKNEEVNNIRIQRDTYRKEKGLEDCDNLEKVMSAWVHRQPLKVKFESV